jgi:hypothetical protein
MQGQGEEGMARRQGTKSLELRGARSLSWLWQRGQLVKFHWHLAMLAGADN